MWLVSMSVACGAPRAPTAPAPTAPSPATIDRFSAAAGHLMVRGGKQSLPAPGQPIDFDQPPFITQALGPDGGIVRYYNFDVQRAAPATIYRLTHAGSHTAISGQLDIIDTLPGDPGYSDFFQLAWVEVPEAFVARAYADIATRPITRDPTLLDCPVVPHGSTAREGEGVAPAVPTQVWYRGVTVDCLLFGAPLRGEQVPTSPIYVTFGHEPADGFKRVGATLQTHNVVLSVPGDTDYSPLWDVHIYDERAFALVHDAASAQKARLIKAGPLVNCPVVTVKPPAWPASTHR